MGLLLSNYISSSYITQTLTSRAATSDSPITQAHLPAPRDTAPYFSRAAVSEYTSTTTKQTSGTRYEMLMPAASESIP